MRLYWYLHAKHAVGFFADGRMYFGHCSSYASERLTAAQRDTEQQRIATFAPNTTRLFVGKSATPRHEIPFTALKAESTLPDYFLRSLSSASNASVNLYHHLCSRFLR